MKNNTIKSNVSHETIFSEVSVALSDYLNAKLYSPESGFTSVRKYRNFLEKLTNLLISLPSSYYQGLTDSDDFKFELQRSLYSLFKSIYSLKEYRYKKSRSAKYFSYTLVDKKNYFHFVGRVKTSYCNISFKVDSFSMYSAFFRILNQIFNIKY